MAIKGVQLTV